MTQPMRSSPAYQALHSKLVQEVRSGPETPAERDARWDQYARDASEDDGFPNDAGQYVHGLLSACASVCALPDHMFAEDDRIDILNVIKNLGMLARRIG